MKIHVCGICGTFMGSLALLARDAGHAVTGSDQNIYPPMSDLLAEQGVEIKSGYSAAHLQPPPDLAIIGNAMSRGNAEVEAILDCGIKYTSGPQWLGDQVLSGRKVISVAGTHGKTTTASMLAWILECAGLDPGFLIGGLPENFGVSARTGSGAWFVVEADEYDTAFFDKRSKFVHYHPHVQILNNLEFDHADIFPDLSAIKTQFHHLVRVVPGSGKIVLNADDDNLAKVLELGCWSPVTRFSVQQDSDWSVRNVSTDGGSFELFHANQAVGVVHWQLMGMHNVLNALAAVAAAQHAAVDVATAIRALESFGGVRRRLTSLGEIAGISVFDDFAHHPTAIRLTLEGLRQRRPQARILVGLEPRSNTMRSGVHGTALREALGDADYVVMLQRPDLGWTLQSDSDPGDRIAAFSSVQAMLDNLVDRARAGDSVIFMSNGGFEQAPARFAASLRAQL